MPVSNCSSLGERIKYLRMKIEFKIEAVENLNTLKVSGDLTVQNGIDFKNHLQTLADAGGDIELCLRKIDTIDVSAIQLVKSFRQLVESLQKKFQVALPEQEDVLRLVNATGLLPLLR